MRSVGMRTAMLAAAAVLTCGAVLRAADTPDFSRNVNWNRDVRSAWQVTRESGRPLLLFLTIDNCLYCEKMKRTTFRDRQVIRYLQAALVPAVLDAKNAPELIKRLQVTSFPATVIIETNGDVIETITGYRTPRQFQRQLHATLRLIAQERRALRR